MSVEVAIHNEYPVTSNPEITIQLSLDEAELDCAGGCFGQVGNATVLIHIADPPITCNALFTHDQILSPEAGPVVIEGASLTVL